jgi:hypothetical protein
MIETAEPTTTTIEALQAMAETPPAAPTLLRMSAENIAAVRPVCIGRWLARLSCPGEQVFERGTIGLEGPTIVHLHPEAMAGLAETITGCPVNHLVREDGMRAGYRPPDGSIPKGFDFRIAAGVVESAWSDGRGVLGVIALWDSTAHGDLLELERLGVDALAFANLCCCFTHTAFKVERSPWKLTVVHVFGARAFSVEFTSLTHAHASFGRSHTTRSPIGTRCCPSTAA